ncbi:hypothetical protein F5050DRAFT_1812992, partial [Lentinula boryana]
MSPIRQNFTQCSASQSSSSSQPTPTHASAIPDASFDSDHLQVAQTLPRALASDIIHPAPSIDQLVPSVRPRMGEGERQLKKATKDNKFEKDIMTFLDHCDKEIKRIAAEPFVQGSESLKAHKCSHFFGNAPIEVFLLSKFGLTGAEFIEAAEAYFIFLSSGRTSTNMGVKAMRKETVKLIPEGLKNITRNDKICMEYKHYEVLIIKEYGIKLIGWPDGVPMETPYNLNAVHAISLYQAVKSKTCMWKPLDRMELHRVKRSIEARVDSGDLAIPERLRRGKGGAGSK